MNCQRRFSDSPALYCFPRPNSIPRSHGLDLSIVQRIKAEAFENSKVMDHEFYLTDVYGPRLTNSPGFKAAGDWVVKRLQGVPGLDPQRARRIVGDPSAEVGTHTHYAVATHGRSRSISLPGLVSPWPGPPQPTEPCKARRFYATLNIPTAILGKFHGKLRGKVVLSMPSKQLTTGPRAARTPSYTDMELEARATSADPSRLANPLPRTSGPRSGR